MDLDRLGMLWVTRPDLENPKEQSTSVGTGYVVSEDLVLTAHHVIFGDSGEETPTKIEFRYAEADPDDWIELELAWPEKPGASEWDICLPRLPEPRSWDEEVSWGRFDRSQAISWETVGFPKAARAPSAMGGRTVYDTAEVAGTLRAKSSIGRGLLEVEADAPAESEDWGGLSGAPVFVQLYDAPDAKKKHLVGVMRSVPKSFKGGRLHATPIEILMEQEEAFEALGKPKLRRVPSSVIDGPLFDALPSLNPASLLNARFRVVPYFKESHQEAWNSLEEWFASSEAMSIRLITGAGGTGKTRLLREWCEGLREGGWRAGFLSEPLNEKETHRLFGTKEPVCVVIDYAEVRLSLLDDLRALFGEKRHKLRVVLLAREEAEWWDHLKTRDDQLQTYLDAHGPLRLRPIQTADELRTKVYEEAYRAFNFHIHKAIDIPDVPPFALQESQFERTLYLHMAAFSVVEGLNAESGKLLDRIVGHEQSFWRRAWAAQLEGKSSTQERRFEEAASRLVAALTLRGGADTEEEALALNERAKGPDEGFVHELEALYPGKLEQASYLSGLEPDLLGEALVRKVLSHKKTNSAQFLESVLEDASDPQSLTSLTVLGRISVDYRELARPWLEEVLLRKARQRGLLALYVALSLGQTTAFASVGEVLAKSLQEESDAGSLAELFEPLIPERTVSLREVAVWVDETLALQTYNLTEDLEQQSRRARQLNNLGNRYSELGQREEALQATQESVQWYRKLAEQRPDAFLPDLAGSLNNLGNRYSALGQREEALQATQEAVQLRRNLAEQRPDAFLPDLAMSLNNLGVRYSALGQREEALQATQEAVQLRRNLAEQRPDAFLPYLAASLNNLGNTYSELGQREEALQATQEAVQLRRKLAEQRPDAFLPDLAGSLNNLGAMYSALGQREDALQTSREGLELYSTLMASYPAAFAQNFLISLRSYANIAQESGLDAEHDESFQNAIRILQELQEANPEEDPTPPTVS